VFDWTNFRKRWEAAVKAAGLVDFHFHDLRHTFASWARMNRADLADISEALDHSTVAVTMRYAHIKPRHRLRPRRRHAQPTKNAPRGTIQGTQVLELTVFGQKRDHYKSGALPTELSRHARPPSPPPIAKQARGARSRIDRGPLPVASGRLCDARRTPDMRV
jgi:hypothetical protein